MAADTPDTQRFRWHGVDGAGAPAQGMIDAPNRVTALARLRQQGVQPQHVRRQRSIFGIGNGSGRARATKRAKRIKSADISGFARQCQTLLGTGVALVPALDILADGHPNPAMTTMLKAIRRRIETGATLSQALSAYPRHYDRLFINLVHAGELAGNLDTLLGQIATYREKTESIRIRVRKALYYPLTVLAAATIVTAILLYFVVPRFQTLFQSYGAELPLFTRLVIELSDQLRLYGWLLPIAIAAGILFCRRLHGRSARFRHALDAVLLRLPIVGDILYKAVVARFARTLSIMFTAGVPLVHSLEATAATAGNRVLAAAIRSAASDVATGRQLHAALTDTALFPDMALQMMAIGEQSGSLDSMCSHIANIYEQEVDNRIDTLSSLLEPLLMAVLGLLVGGLVIAMYLPVFQLGSVI